ncbi:MAG: DUF4354 family protein [Brucella intermedia]
MFKQVNLLVKIIMSLLVLPQSVHAETARKDLIVTSAPTTRSATSMEDKVYFTQRFDVVIGNVGNSDISLKDVVLVAQGDNGKLFDTDTIEDTLTSGILKPGQSAKGFVAFAYEDKTVYGAWVVKVAKQP